MANIAAIKDAQQRKKIADAQKAYVAPAPKPAPTPVSSGKIGTAVKVSKAETTPYLPAVTLDANRAANPEIVRREQFNQLTPQNQALATYTQQQIAKGSNQPVQQNYNAVTGQNVNYQTRPDFQYINSPQNSSEQLYNQNVAKQNAKMMEPGGGMTLDFIGQIQDPYVRGIKLQEYYEQHGGGAAMRNLFSGSPDDELQDLLNKQETQRSQLELKLDLQKKMAERQRKGAIDSSKAIFGQDREGVMSSTRAMLPSVVTEVTGDQMQALNYELGERRRNLEDMQQQQLKQWVAGRDSQIQQERQRIAELEAQTANYQAKQQEAIVQQQKQSMDMLKFAQDAGSLAFMDESTIAGLASVLPPGMEGIVRGAVQGARQKYLGDQTKEQFSNLQTFKSLLSDGTPMSNDMLLNFAQSTGLPLEALFNINQQAQSIAEDKSMDRMTKMLNFEKLGVELDRLKRGVDTDAARKMEYVKNQLADLKASGASQEEMDAATNEIMTMMGIESTQNPKYQAELRIKQAEADMKEIERTMYGPEKDLAMRQASTNLMRSMAEYENYMSFGAAKEMYDLAYKETQTALEQKKLRGEPITIQDKDALFELQKKRQQYYGGQAYVPKSSESGITITMENGSYNINVPDNAKFQCGEFVNRVWGLSSSAGGGFGDTPESKLELIDSRGIRTEDISDAMAQIKPGMAFVQGGGTYGHVGIVTSVIELPDGQVRIRTKEANPNPTKNFEGVETRERGLDEIDGFVYPPAGSYEELNQSPMGANKYETLANDVLSGSLSYKDYLSGVPADDKLQAQNLISQKISDSVKTEFDPLSKKIQTSILKDDLDATAQLQLNKFSTVFTQLTDIRDTVQALKDKGKTGLLSGNFAKWDITDPDIDKLKKQITGITPNVARGVFGEVGVLTNVDIENYSKIITDIGSTSEQIENSLNNLEGLVFQGFATSLNNSNKNVSNFNNDYVRIRDSLSPIVRQKLGVTNEEDYIRKLQNESQQSSMNAAQQAILDEVYNGVKPDQKPNYDIISTNF